MWLAAFSKATTSDPWKPVRSYSEVRPARPGWRRLTKYRVSGAYRTQQEAAPGAWPCYGRHHASNRTSRVRRRVVGRHSDAVDVTGPIDMTGLDAKRHSLTPLMITAVILLGVAAIVVLLLAL
jgi:hypothetical protein